MTMMTTEQATRLRGCEVYDQSGEKIGKVEDFYYDESTNQPEWLGVSSGIFGTKHVLVPLEGIQPGADRVVVPYSKDLVKETPDIDDEVLTDAREQEL